MASFCVRLAPASAGARCVCLGAAVHAGSSLAFQRLSRATLKFILSA
eukprot:gene20428-biopygen23566